jgi:hypothetical protein
MLGAIAAGLGTAASWLGANASWVVPTATAAAGTAVNYLSQRSANKQNVDLYHDAQNYNAPVNQMSRLKQAGLNPHLVYGSGSVAGNLSAPPPQVKAPRVDTNAAVNAYAQAAQVQNMFAQNENLSAQNSLIKSQKNYYDALTLQTAAQAGVTSHDLGLVEGTYSSSKDPAWFRLGGRLIRDLINIVLPGMNNVGNKESVASPASKGPVPTVQQSRGKPLWQQIKDAYRRQSK